MTRALREFWLFVRGSLGIVARGGAGYYAWVAFLLVLIAVGASAYGNQLQHGLVTSNMRDSVSWGFYIGNFAFLVGVAAAAVVLVIPAYVYQWGPIRDVVLLGELMAVSAIIMCILFVTVDVGRPDRLWHLMPGVGHPNFPYSLLVWDILVLTSYFLLNYFIVTYLVFKAYRGQKYNPGFVLPLVFLSIPLAISIHTVTAFLFMALKARPFWHSALLAPRFLASAFCSGPSILLLIFLTIRRLRRMTITDAAIFKIGELLAYAMAVNLFFIAVEVFTEFYAQTSHSIHAQFQWFGVHGRTDIALYTWFALACDVLAFVIFMVPALRRRTRLLAGAAGLAIAGVYIEKGLGLLLPGMTPAVLGDVYPYNPSLNELLVGAGVWGTGALAFTLMTKVALGISAGEFKRESDGIPAGAYRTEPGPPPVPDRPF